MLYHILVFVNLDLLPSIGGRTLPNGGDVAGGSAAMTVDLCTAACQTQGYTLAGIEYSGECCKINIFPNYCVLIENRLWNKLPKRWRTSP